MPRTWLKASTELASAPLCSTTPTGPRQQRWRDRQAVRGQEVGGVDVAVAVRAEHGQPVRPAEGGEFLLALAPLRPGLAEARGQHHVVADAEPRALLEHVEDDGGRHHDVDEVDRPGGR